MNESDIRKYANLMSELGLTGLEVTENDRVVRLERNPAPQTAAPVQTVQVADAPPSAANEDLMEITSPMVGVFYAAPAEDADPYVQVGDRVTCVDDLWRKIGPDSLHRGGDEAHERDCGGNRRPDRGGLCPERPGGGFWLPPVPHQVRRSP